MHKLSLNQVEVVDIKLKLLKDKIIKKVLLTIKTL